MNRTFLGAAACVILAAGLTGAAPVAHAQSAEVLEEVVVTGSRIRRDPLDEAAAIMDIGSEDLDRTGLTNLGAMLQQLPITGSAINTKFNVPGNSGFPQDGNGIGAGAAQLSLRNVGAKRTLILVDGKRWIAGASASGVPSAVDLNTLPSNVIQRIEILQDGASAIYGSDAIGGVVNVITRSNYEGFKADFQAGSYFTEDDGEAYEASFLWGGGNDTTHFVFSAGYSEEQGIETADRAQSAFPNPFATSCNVAGSRCSGFTPQGTVGFGPNFAGGATIILNDGVLNDGGANIPQFDPNNPASLDYHAFGAADRFNFNGPGFNFLQTPNERINLYGDIRHSLSDRVDFVVRAAYTNRSSATKGAPEPLCLGNGCGNPINDNMVVSALNPFNPFGVNLSVADGTLEFIGRRPLESGPRLFFQDVNTYYVSAGLEGEFDAASRSFYWDVTAIYGDNRGFQEKQGAHNAARLAIALGDPSVCAAVPGCVPFNILGGQGPNGEGSITQAMLDYVGFVQRDFSEQTLADFSANIAGDLADLPAGNLGFAAGFEFREHDGTFRPDPVAARAETAGIPSGATDGRFDVTEYYAELSIPLLSGVNGADYLELNVAGRGSDYSTFGTEGTYKASLLYRPVADELSFRGSFSTGLRAPGIGELFGGAAREDFTFLDPCADVNAQFGSANGGRDTPQTQSIVDNCAALGVPLDFTQRNPQLSAVSAGNENLTAETSDNFTAGVVLSPSFLANRNWVEAVTLSVDYYSLEIDDAVQGRDPGDIINACVNTLDPLFCDPIDRTPSGLINLVDNQLQNIGGIEASGIDIALDYTGPETGIGQFNIGFNATHLADYTEFTANPDGTQTATDRTGTITNETFQRAFPEWRWTTALDWRRDRWSGGLTLRWVDEMAQPSGVKLDSKLFTDLQVRYNPPVADDRFYLTLGFNNLLDEDPAVCNACGVINMSPVVHDLPGVVGYLRVTYEQ